MSSSVVDVVGAEEVCGGSWEREGEGGCEVERRFVDVLGRRDEKREWRGRDGAGAGVGVGRGADGEPGREVDVWGAGLGLDFRRRSSSS